MKSLCIVLGFTLLLAAACGVTLIGDGGGCSGRRLFRACPHDPAAAAPAKPVMASDLFSIPAGNCPAVCRCRERLASSLRSAARNLRCIKADFAI